MKRTEKSSRLSVSLDMSGYRWLRADDRNTLAISRIREVVPNRMVLSAAIVPKGQCVWFPTNAAVELRLSPEQIMAHFEKNPAFEAFQPSVTL